MNEEMIINKLRKIQELRLDKNTEKVDEIDKRFDALVKKIGKTDFDLADDLDSIVGEIYGALADMYFTIGYKAALKEVNSNK